MYVRSRKNKNGSTSIQIIDKSSGIYKVVKHIGTANNNIKLETLKKKAYAILHDLKFGNALGLFDAASIKSRIRTISSTPIGFRDIFGKVFDEIGFSEVINASLFKDLVVFRIAYPVSKLRTVSIMNTEYGFHIDKMKVYRFMDSIDESTRERLSLQGFNYVKNTTDSPIDVVFFDCTTLHYESFDEDDFRKNGYSKVGKFNQPQILVALLVTKEGIPIGYEAFSGNTFEGHTLIPVLTKIRFNYKLENIVFVADSGMLNEKNLQELDRSNFEYIVGAKIKSESHYYKTLILDNKNYKNDIAEFRKSEDLRLVVSYSEKRAKKDRMDREKSIERLKKQLVSKDKLSKSLVGNQGARKYIKLVGESAIYWNQEKIDEDSKWDGLKGVLTNNMSLSTDEVINKYKNLWQVEEAFRMSKTDLRMRPIFHWRKSRIEAHLAITFAALLVGKITELKLKRYGYSLQRILEILRSVNRIEQEDTLNGEKFSTITQLSDEAKNIYDSLRVSF